MNRNFDDAVKCIDYKRIMDKVCSKYNKAVDPDELSSLWLVTLWECLKKYDATRGAKFTSYLYQQLTYAIKNSLKKKKREFTNIPIEIPKTPTENLAVALHGIPSEYEHLLKQKYLQNMTMEEIGRANGYSRETARRKIKRAISHCKKINYEDRSLV